MCGDMGIDIREIYGERLPFRRVLCERLCDERKCGRMSAATSPAGDIPGKGNEKGGGGE
jgi:hypothetical protein